MPFFSCARRHADVYVFCLLDHKDRATVDPLNVDQWRFFVLATRVLDAKVGTQRRIALKPLLALGPIEVKFGGIGQAIENAMR